VARDLGIGEHMLGRWKKQYEQDGEHEPLAQSLGQRGGGELFQYAEAGAYAPAELPDMPKSIT